MESSKEIDLVGAQYVPPIPVSPPLNRPRPKRCLWAEDGELTPFEILCHVFRRAALIPNVSQTCVFSPQLILPVPLTTGAKH